MKAKLTSRAVMIIDLSLGEDKKIIVDWPIISGDDNKEQAVIDWARKIYQKVKAQRQNCSAWKICQDWAGYKKSGHLICFRCPYFKEGIDQAGQEALSKIIKKAGGPQRGPWRSPEISFNNLEPPYELLRYGEDIEDKKPPEPGPLEDLEEIEAQLKSRVGQADQPADADGASGVNSGDEKVSIKNLLFKKFLRWEPENIFVVDSGKGALDKFSAPPFFPDYPEDEVKRIKELLFKKFDIEEIRAAGKNKKAKGDDNMEKKSKGPGRQMVAYQVRFKGDEEASLCPFLGENEREKKLKAKLVKDKFVQWARRQEKPVELIAIRKGKPSAVMTYDPDTGKFRGAKGKVLMAFFRKTTSEKTWNRNPQHELRFNSRKPEELGKASSKQARKKALEFANQFGEPVEIWKKTKNDKDFIFIEIIQPSQTDDAPAKDKEPREALKKLEKSPVSPQRVLLSQKIAKVMENFPVDIYGGNISDWRVLLSENDVGSNGTGVHRCVQYVGPQMMILEGNKTTAELRELVRTVASKRIPGKIIAMELSPELICRRLDERDLMDIHAAEQRKAVGEFG